MFDYKLSQMFLGDICTLKILRQGEVMNVEVKLDLVTSLVPTQLYDKRPRYLYLALINRAGGLYQRILTEIVSTDRTQ